MKSLPLGLLFLLAGCAPVISVDPVAGRVVDAAKGTPVGGVQILAVWLGKVPQFHGHATFCLAMKSVQSNAEGRFALKGRWKPNLRFASHHDLVLLAHKAGYQLDARHESSGYGASIPGHYQLAAHRDALPPKERLGYLNKLSERVDRECRWGFKDQRDSLHRFDRSIYAEAVELVPADKRRPTLTVLSPDGSTRQMSFPKLPGRRPVLGGGLHLAEVAIRSHLDGDLPASLSGAAPEQARWALNTPPNVVRSTARLRDAITAGDDRAARQALENGADPTAADGEAESLLALAVRHGRVELAAELRRRGAQLEPLEQAGAFTEAVRQDRPGMLTILNRDAASPNTARDVGLLQAIYDGRPAMVEELLEGGASPNARSDLRGNAVGLAAQKQQEPVVRHLLEAGADPNPWNSKGEPMLPWLVRYRPRIAELLIDAGADLDVQVPHLYSPLESAIMSGQSDLARKLLERGANPNLWRKHGSPLVAACSKGNLHLVRMMVEHGVQLDGKHGYRAQFAAREHRELMQYLVDQGAPVNDPDGVNYLLAGSAGGGKLDLVRFLVKHGSDPNASNTDRSTPLMAAARNGQLEVLDYLLEVGAEIDRPNRKGVTALMVAADGGWREHPKPGPSRETVMASQGGMIAMAAPSVVQFKGRERVAVVARLLRVGADPNARDADGWTALMRAAERGHARTVKLLIEAGARPAFKNGAGMDALQIARESQQMQVEALLIQSANTAP